MKAYVGDFWKGRAFVENQSIPEIKGGNQVLVRVICSAINPADYKIPSIFLPTKVVGLDLAGIVAEVGEDVMNFKEGDRVFGNTWGSLAEYAVCDAEKIAKIPETMGFEEAAAMPTTYLTGYQALVNHGFKKGDKLLIIGGSGGCGTAGIQLAKALGASEIVAVCSARNINFVTGIGATAAIDYKTQNVLNEYGKDYFDFVYDTVGGINHTEVRKLLGKEGMFVTIAPSISIALRYFSNLQKQNSKMIFTNHSKNDLEQILDLKREDGFEPVIHKKMTFTRDNVEEGFKLLKSHRTKGKILFMHENDDH